MFPKLCDLLGVQCADEILLSEEFEKSDEVTMAFGASPVREPRVAHHVPSEGQSIRASWTLGAARNRDRRGGGPFPDELHQLQSRSWRDLEIFILVEPERLTGHAQVNRNGPPLVAFECHARHIRTAIWTHHSRAS